MKYFALLLILFSFTQVLWAQPIEGDGEAPKKYLMIDSFNRPFLSTMQLDQINKTMLKVATKQLEYSLILGQGKEFEGIKVMLASMQLSVEKVDSNFEIKGLLLDMKNKKVIKKIVEERVAENMLLHRIYVVLDKLFHPDVPVVKPRALKKKSLTDAAEAQRNLEDEKAADDFRDRIKGIKNGIAVTIEQIKDKEQESLTKGDEAKSKNSASTSNQSDDKNNTSASNSKSKENGGDFEPPAKKASGPSLASVNAIRLGYRTQTTDSKDLLETNTVFKFLVFGYERGFFLNADKSHQIMPGFTFGRLNNKFTTKVSPYTRMSLEYRYILHTFHFAPGIGFEKETLSFINLPSPGEGIKAANNNLTWLKARIDAEMTISKLSFLIGGYLAQNLMTKSDYPTVSYSSGLTGKKFGARLQWNDIIKSFHLEVEYFKINLSAEGGARPITYTSSGNSINALYTF
ncbi:MAG: hypothetical protein ACOYL6_08180 [Bacteriovoracaceae bacterium]